MGVKTLISSILIKNPQKRSTISDITKHPWYIGHSERIRLIKNTDPIKYSSIFKSNNKPTMLQIISNVFKIKKKFILKSRLDAKIAAANLERVLYSLKIIFHYTAHNLIHAECTSSLKITPLKFNIKIKTDNAQTDFIFSPESKIDVLEYTKYFDKIQKLFNKL